MSYSTSWLQRKHHHQPLARKLFKDRLMYRKWKAAILREISPEMVERIIHLNACLFEAATWITKRARFTRDAYIAGGGAADEQQRGDHWEYFELEAVIKCSLDHDSLEFKPDDEHANMIAVVTSSQKHMHELEDDDLTWSYCGDGQPTCERPTRRTRRNLNKGTCFKLRALQKSVKSMDLRLIPTGQPALEFLIRVQEYPVHNIYRWRFRLQRQSQYSYIGICL